MPASICGLRMELCCSRKAGQVTVSIGDDNLIDIALDGSRWALGAASI